MQYHQSDENIINIFTERCSIIDLENPTCKSGNFTFCPYNDNPQVQEVIQEQIKKLKGEIFLQESRIQRLGELELLVKLSDFEL